MTPVFSVIIPLYNKESYIENTLKSVLDQTFTDFEVVIVDDGSTDDSLKIASQFQDPRITVVRQKNKGASVTRNRGVELAKAPYMALLDADDLWYKDHLFELKSLIDTFPNAGLFCNNYEIKLGNHLISKAHFNFSYQSDHTLISDFFAANIFNFIPTSSSVAFLKSSFMEIGAYNTSLRTGQDIDLWIRLALKHKVAFNPKITMRYNHFDVASLSKSNYNADRYHLISLYHKEERQNPSLKLYLDVNRYAVALRCKMNDEKALYNKLKEEIDHGNLNLKQKLLLKLPTPLLKLVKKAQKFLIKRSVYVTAYK